MLLLLGTLDSDLSFGHSDPTKKPVQVLIFLDVQRDFMLSKLTSANKEFFGGIKHSG